jgi:hypothetical protein
MPVAIYLVSNAKGFAKEGFKSEKYASGDIPVTFFFY